MKLAAEVLQWLCLAAAAWFILAFIYVASSSMSYPFYLEWMEGQSIDIVQRLLDGKPFYAKPSIEYVAYIYTPLYFYVSALVAKFTGIGFFPTRMVSTLSALGTGFLIYKWIQKSSSSWKAGVIGAGLFFATYRLSGRWFDNSRVDSLFLFLTLASLYAYSHYKGWKYAVLAGILGIAAFFTKQAALGMIMPVFVAGLFLEKRQAIVALTVITVGTCGGVWIYNTLSDGWFNFFVFKVPAGHGFDHRQIWDFWHNDIFHSLLILLVITQLMISFSGLRDWKMGVHYNALVMGALIAAYIARMHSFGYINVLMPAHLILALMTGLAFGYVWRYASDTIKAAMGLAVLMQMHMLFYNPALLIPKEKSIEVGNRFLEGLARIDGDVLIPELQYIQTRAGKKSYALGMAAFDIMRSDLKNRNNVKKEFIEELSKEIASGRFNVIMPGRIVPLPSLNEYYSRYDRLQYPREYVTGAVNFLNTDLYMRNDLYFKLK